MHPVRQNVAPVSAWESVSTPASGSDQSVADPDNERRLEHMRELTLRLQDFKWSGNSTLAAKVAVCSGLAMTAGYLFALGLHAAGVDRYLL
ncbi:MAG: hypothetical protein AAGA21_16015 [Pseudomonadota bacterium]